MYRIIICLLLTANLSANGQVAPERVMTGQMESGKWVKIRKSLNKSLSKDTLNPEARYLLSLFFFNNNYSTYNLDSSYIYVLQARQNYLHSQPNDRERLKKVPLDTIILSRLKSRIDSAAFEKAKQSNTIVSYQYFIDHHRTAKQLSSAVELRDAVAFLDALKINTWASFKRFMTLYPASHRKDEARTRYDRLLYEDKTKDKKLSSYIKFHQQFAESPYRVEAERNIFELSTLSGSSKSFQRFITGYPKSNWTRRAINIMYGFQRTEGNEIFDKSWLSDSLRKVEALNQFYWVPVFKSGLFGFMDEQGTETLAPQFTSIGEDYNCGNITDHFLVTSSGLIGRDGSMLCRGKVNEARDLGLGFIEVTLDTGRYVIHESGFVFEKMRVDGAKMLSDRFIALQKNKKWAIYSLTGKSILPFTSDNLDAHDSLIVLDQNGKKIITTPYRMIRDMEKTDGKEVFVFDDVKRWGSQQYWVRNGLLEGVIDANLKFIIPLDRQLLRKTAFGFLREKEKRLFIQGIPRFENKAYQSVYEQANWVRMETPAGGYVLYEKILGQVVEGDSAWFQRQIAFMVSGDSVHAYLPSGQKLSFFEKSIFRLMESKDSSAWMVLDEKKKKTVYDAASGEKLFTAEFDQIEPVSAKLFLITKSGKKGIVSVDGKVLVPAEYDAIVSTSDHTFSLLRDKKFGWYDARTRQLMKPVYDRNVKLYNDHYRLAFKEKGYAFIRPDGAPLGNFEWEDFQFWNDSVAWVKKNFQWILLSIHEQKVRIDRVRSFSTVLDSPAEKIYSVRQDNATGIVSNKRGIIIPFKYSDIINLGTAEDPLYFTERHIEEAAISVVVYYDKQGKIIRRQAMETDEFEKIVCDN